VQKNSQANLVADLTASALPEASAARALQYGVIHEEEARLAYVHFRRQEATSADAACSLQVREIGIFIMPEEPWLAGSPDGLCFEADAPVGLLEVKTSRSWKSFENIQLPVDWLYQVQGSMRIASSALGIAICWCDLFLWTPQKFECRRIAFDAALWDTVMFPRLRSFYFDIFLPKLTGQEEDRQEVAQQKRPSRNGRKGKGNGKGGKLAFRKF